MSTCDYHHCCHAWGIDVEDDESLPCVIFKIEFFAMLLLKPTEEYIIQTGGLHYSLQYNNFRVDRDRLINDDNNHKIRGFFLAMKLQPQQPMIDAILECARAIVSNESYSRNRKVLGMQVNVVAAVDELPENPDENSITRDEEGGIEMVSARDNDLPINNVHDCATMMKHTFMEFASLNFSDSWTALEEEVEDSIYDGLLNALNVEEEEEEEEEEEDEDKNEDQDEEEDSIYGELLMRLCIEEEDFSYSELLSTLGVEEEEEEEEEDSLSIVPASEESIEKLKIIVVKDSTTQLCVICLETLEVGSKATSMPCLHVFHGDCIVQWLETRNFCPLCRHELPARELSVMN